MSNGRLLPIQENEGRLPTDYSIFDESDAHSLINVVPPNLRALIENLDISYLTMGEDDLRSLANPDSTLNCLRMGFWSEYTNSITAARAFNITNVSSGICTRELFGHLILDKNRLAWIILPPRQYLAMQEEILLEGIHKLRAFLQTPAIDRKTTVKIGKEGERTETVEEKINVSAIGEARKLVEMLENRIKGAVVQRHAIQTQDVSGALPSPSSDPMAVLQKALALIEAADPDGEDE